MVEAAGTSTTESGDLRHAVLEIEYLGTRYHGWARQPGYPSVEETLRDAFSGIDAAVVELRCAGRTDAGVHATAQVVDVRYDGPVPPANLARALNARLPVDIAALRSAEAPSGFDARAHATSRAYEYRVLTRRVHSPVREGRVLHHPRRIDAAALEAAAQAFLGQHDFTAFTPSRTLHRYFRRTVGESAWQRRGDELVYRVRANAFLRSQVRVMVGTMLACGRGELALPDLVALLDGGTRSGAAATAPPDGLCLVDVTWTPVDGIPVAPGWSPPAALPFH